MSFMLVMGHCYSCHQLMSFNPFKVPSLPAKLTTTGTREPICRTCVERVNPQRVANGLPKIEIRPDAYEAEEVGY